MSAGYSYEAQHNRFVTSENGCSPYEILQVLTSVSLMPILTSLTIPWIVPTSFTKLTEGNHRAFACVKAVIEYPIVFLGPLLFITTLAGPEDEDLDDEQSRETGAITFPFSSCVAATLTLACMGIVIVNHAITQPIWTGLKEEWNKIRGKPINWSAVRFSLEKESPGLPGRNRNGGSSRLKPPFITNYRGIVTYMTILSILAVDLVIFPRRFAKTKKFGFSLMDVGTGSFMFANGIVSPEARSTKIGKPNLKKAWVSCLPLLALGFIRLLTVKGMEYPEVEEEYGVHWNFFFTLAAVKILSSLLFTIVQPRSALKVACFIGFLYDLIIIPSGFQDTYILNPDIPRNSNLIAANREGIFSVPGYLTIFVASVYIGQLIFNNVKARRTLEDWAYYGGQAGSQVIILWIITFISNSYWSPVCRRSANLSYVLWIISANYTILWLQFCLCFSQKILQHLGLLHGPLIFYELRKKSLKSIQIRLDKKQISEDDEEENEGEEEEEEFEHLESKLEEIHQELRNRKKPAEKIELADITKDIEKKLEVVGEKYVKDELKKVEAEIKEKGTPGNLVKLTDLTGASVSLEAISYNGLGLFLLGNLLTGLINSTFYSMYLPNSTALLILWTYASTVGFTSLALYWFNVQIKFW